MKLKLRTPMLPLDRWTAQKISIPHESFTRAALDIYTADRLYRTIKYAAANSAFYSELFGKLLQDTEFLRLQKTDGSLDSDGFFRWFSKVPFTDSEQLCNRGNDMLCVRPGDISRIVTLSTGGTTGSPKRVYFTEADQQLTVDYFANGMQLLVDDTDTVLILMPSQMTGSIGLLLAEAVKRIGARAMPEGLPLIISNDASKMRMSNGEKLPDGGGPLNVSPQTTAPDDDGGDIDRIVKLILDNKVTSIVALPTHIDMIAKRIEESARGGAIPKVAVRSVLLSAEYVPEQVVENTARVLDCEVFQHYGMTEMGLGCAVSCGFGKGYHIRESDLYLEIIDSATGEIIEDGREGEVVFTTLNRRGMPFIRYRTGDFSRWIEEPCPCGSILKRLDKITDRRIKKGYLQ